MRKNIFTDKPSWEYMRNELGQFIKGHNGFNNNGITLCKDCHYVNEHERKK